MKLATLKSSDRDGVLAVVDKNLNYALPVPGIASCLQRALDNWAVAAPALEAAYEQLNRQPSSDAIRFDPSNCAAPLPRAYQWVDGSAYVNHVELVRRARGVELPESFWREPLVYQGGSDDFLGPTDDIVASSEDFGIDLEGETAVITDDVPMATKTNNAGKHIKLILLVNDVSLRNLIPSELAKGFGFYQGKPSSAFSPVAVTPNELGQHWRNGTVNRPLTVHLNGALYGEPHCGIDMTFNFEQLVEHATKTRKLGAGTVIGSGTISNYDRSRGSACIAERRMLETIEHGSPKTPFLKFGDRVRIEMFDTDGISIFGAIDQVVAQATNDAE
ncbi:MAG: fumarylacetoacetate (FAA) hydrolase [Gammaproteobacteria bacterium]